MRAIETRAKQYGFSKIAGEKLNINKQVDTNRESERDILTHTQTSRQKWTLSPNKAKVEVNFKQKDIIIHRHFKTCAEAYI